MDSYSTANAFTKVLYRVMLEGEDMNSEDSEFWSQVAISIPVVNNIIVTLPSGKQYNIQVKPVNSVSR